MTMQSDCSRQKSWKTADDVMQKRERLFFSGNKRLFLLQGNASVPCTLSTAKDFFDGQMRSSQYKLQKVRGNADMDNSFLFKL